MANGGPWGNGPDGKDRGEGQRGNRRPPAGSGGSQVPPELDEFVKKGREQLRVFVGGKKSGGSGNGGGSGPGGAPEFNGLGKWVVLGAAALAVALWAFASLYTVRPEERSVELFFGKFSSVGNPGLNFAPWPFVRAEVVQVTFERQTNIGSTSGTQSSNPFARGFSQAAGNDDGLMLTRDQNIVDIDFQVVWNIADPAKFLFNLADPSDTIRAVSASAMRDIIARSELAPILNRDRGVIASDVRLQIQETLDSYDAGLNVIRVNFEKADPPAEVLDAFREVQAAQQERDRLEKEADAYANRVTAGARGEAAQLLEESEAYRAQVVNAAEGEASRFLSVYSEYVKAPEVTRKRMYLETLEKVYSGIDKVILDGVQGGSEGAAGTGVLPYLPLNELIKSGSSTTDTRGQTQ